MKSNYKRLGDFITLVNKKNKGLVSEDLRGLSMTKEFRKTTSNIIGTDLSNYKLVYKNQFACDFMSIIRVHKFPVVLHHDDKPIIISPAYPVFEVKDEEELNPKYLMMWFRRTEFDRYADFKCDSAIRGGFKWDELCEVELPIPSIEKQREIVKEYNTVVNRIKLNETLNQKLEETAKALYKHWFVDFEFPNENGEPYKSSGGKLVFNTDLEKDIPEGWGDGLLSDIMVFKNGKTRPNSKGIIPVYGGNGVLDNIREYNNEDVIVIGRVGAYCGSLFRVLDKCWISDNAICGVSKSNYNMFCFDLLKELNLNEKSEGTGQPLLTQGILNNIEIVIPNENTTIDYDKKSKILFNKLSIQSTELELLRELEITILSKMTMVEVEKEMA